MNGCVYCMPPTSHHPATQLPSTATETAVKKGEGKGIKSNQIKSNQIDEVIGSDGRRAAVAGYRVTHLRQVYVPANTGPNSCHWK
jgi:hypothetical protein